MSRISFDKWLQALGKLDYVQGKTRPDVKCILCSIKENDEKVVSLKIYEDEICFVTINLYPFNPGHLMCVPNRHITKYTELTKKELLHLNRAIQGLQLLLDDLYNPKGYNIGINQGNYAGASIDHLHFHVVPRYGTELGFIDIVGNTRVLPEGLDSVKKKLNQNVNKFLNKEFFEDFK
ncbi:MAG: HIT domain-containing protein [Candidatus Lokiarchaeota archaeon]|nr:HIT domain-containing protein [Candidatus Lokiarchaeota archaeon]